MKKWRGIPCRFKTLFRMTTLSEKWICFCRFHTGISFVSQFWNATSWVKFDWFKWSQIQYSTHHLLYSNNIQKTKPVWILYTIVDYNCYGHTRENVFFLKAYDFTFNFERLFFRFFPFSLSGWNEPFVCACFSPETFPAIPTQLPCM